MRRVVSVSSVQHDKFGIMKALFDVEFRVYVYDNSYDI